MIVGPEDDAPLKHLRTGLPWYFCTCKTEISSEALPSKEVHLIVWVPLSRMDQWSGVQTKKGPSGLVPLKSAELHRLIPLFSIALESQFVCLGERVVIEDEAQQMELS